MVQGIVGQSIGELVVFAAHVVDGKFPKAARQFLSLTRERCQLGIANLVLPVHLTHHQFAIAEDVQLLDAQLQCEPERF